MQIVRSQLALAAVAAMMAHGAAAQGSSAQDLPIPSALNSQSVGEVLSKASLKRQLPNAQSLGSLGQGLPTDLSALTGMLGNFKLPLKREEAGVNVLGNKVPSNSGELTESLGKEPLLASVMPKLYQRDTGLGLDVDQKPAPEFLVDTVAKTLGQRDFSTSDFNLDKTNLETVGPTAQQVAAIAVPVAMAPAKPYLQTVGTGYKVANAAAHAVGADKMAADAVQGAMARLQQRDSLDLADSDNTDLSGLEGLPNQAVVVAAPIALSKVGGYTSTARTGAQVAGMAAKAAGVPEAIQKSGVPQAVHDTTAKLQQPKKSSAHRRLAARKNQEAKHKKVEHHDKEPKDAKEAKEDKKAKDSKEPKDEHKVAKETKAHEDKAKATKHRETKPEVSKHAKAPAPKHKSKHDEEDEDELTKTGLKLGEKLRETALGASGTTTDASGAFVKGFYGERPKKRDTTLPAFSLFPGAGPEAKDAAEGIASALGVPIPNAPKPAAKRMEKLKRKL